MQKRKISEGIHIYLSQKCQGVGSTALGLHLKVFYSRVLWWLELFSHTSRIGDSVLTPTCVYGILCLHVLPIPCGFHPAFLDLSLLHQSKDMLCRQTGISKLSIKCKVLCECLCACALQKTVILSEVYCALCPESSGISFRFSESQWDKCCIEWIN